MFWTAGASTEALAQAERIPGIREQIAGAFERSRTELAADLHGIDGAGGERELACAVGSVHMALAAGLPQQWLVDPERAPSARDMAAGLRAIARDLDPGTRPGGGSGAAFHTPVPPAPGYLTGPPPELCRRVGVVRRVLR